jgi:hypothetical protein
VPRGIRKGKGRPRPTRWARKGSRLRAAHDQRTQSTYLFGAVCPERGAGAALVLNHRQSRGGVRFPGFARFAPTLCFSCVRLTTLAQPKRG